LVFRSVADVPKRFADNRDNRRFVQREFSSSECAEGRLLAHGKSFCNPPRGSRAMLAFH